MATQLYTQYGRTAPELPWSHEPTSFSLTPKSSTRASNLSDNGKKNYKKVAHDLGAMVSCSYLLAAGLYKAFTAFYKDDLLFGKRWFFIKLPSGVGAQWVIARFTEPYTSKPLGGRGWEVSFSLEIRERALSPQDVPVLYAGDPDFASVSLLLPMNGSNGGTSFPDASTFAHAMLPTGVVTSTADSQWGGSSGLFNNGNMRTALDAGFLYTGDFSIEVWINFTSITGYNNYVCDHNLNGLAFGIVPDLGQVLLYNGSFIINYAGTTPFVVGTWYFMQLIRSGSTITIARNGVPYATGSSAATLGSSSGMLAIGNTNGGGVPFMGYMQDFRITNGMARPIAVPTAPFPTSPST